MLERVEERAGQGTLHEANETRRLQDLMECTRSTFRVVGSTQ